MLVLRDAFGVFCVIIKFFVGVVLVATIENDNVVVNCVVAGLNFVTSG